MIETRVSSRFNSLSVFLKVATCLFFIAKLLFFPSLSVHDFTGHLGAPNALRIAVGHNPVVRSDVDGRESVTRSLRLPTFSSSIETAGKIVPSRNFDSIPKVPLIRRLSRLKLNPSGSGGQDPLLRA